MRAKEMRSLTRFRCTGHRLVKCSGDRVIVVGGGNHAVIISANDGTRSEIIDMVATVARFRRALHHACCEYPSRRHIALFAGPNGAARQPVYFRLRKVHFKRMDGSVVRSHCAGLGILSSACKHPDLGDAQLGNGQRTFLFLWWLYPQA